MKKGNLVNVYISPDEQEHILRTLTSYWLYRVFIDPIDLNYFKHLQLNHELLERQIKRANNGILKISIFLV